jgi:tRNA modification GTPase
MTARTSFSDDDTIVAIATPPGRGGIGVVRLSGPSALAIAGSLTGRSEAAFVPRYATFAKVRRGLPGDEHQSAPFDHVVCTFFPSPRSYTGEDVVEISSHGSPVVLAGIVAEASARGARVARPGEFTFRAFLNGRMNLVQAEAVNDLVEAVTPAQARVAFDQLEGTLTTAIRSVERSLFELVAKLEASLDFPDEDYHFVSPADLAGALRESAGDIERLLETGREGRVIREGAHVVITGAPNVGKSSLFNALVGASRAIVTPVAGTTRDLLTERCDIQGIPVTFVDTAGLRESADVIEQEGVSRARGATAVADVCVLVLDRSESLPSDVDRLIDGVRSTSPILVASKCDLAARWDASALDVRGEPPVSVSARTGEGLPALRARLVHRLSAAEPRRDSARISNIRHIRLLEQAGRSLRAAERAVADGMSEEFVLADLRESLMAFDQVVGVRTSEDILSEIFAKFCIGK